MILFGALMLLDALLLWAIIARSTRWWWLKLCAIIAVVAVNFLTVNAFNTGSGWPATSFPAQDALFLDCYVIEPDPVSGGGAIYLVVVPDASKPVIGYRSHDGSPKIFAVPYSRDLHKECLAAKKQTAQGQMLKVGRRARPSKRPGHNGHGHFVFYHLPPPQPPRKVHP